jgi:VacB/RNase II family 3'-5' exoribonuclease
MLLKGFPFRFAYVQLRRISTTTSFEPYFGPDAITKGILDGEVVAGELHVSSHNNNRARLSVDSKSVLHCMGFVNRNRALHGDRVYAQLIVASEPKPNPADIDSNSSDEASTPGDTCDDQSCKVVGIEKRSDRRYVARCKAFESLVQPRDTRLPAFVEESLKSSPVAHSSLALIKFRDWPESTQFPYSSLVRLLGREGSFAAEDDASLEMFGLLSDRYSDEMEDALREKFPSQDAVITSELTNPNRIDVRRTERIFTIDPPSARDLDDAVSVTHVSGSVYRIGVHVADVSYFIPFGSDVDTAARERSTSVYVPRQVYPMLPAYLSENLCSLLPDHDKLAFSVYFDIDKDSGRIVEQPEFKRTVIRSEARFEYDEVDAIASGEITTPIGADLHLLMEITTRMRKNRIDEGSVTIDDRDGPELKFDFHDLDNGEPAVVGIMADCPTLSTHNSHHLIEELMVQANKLVAEKLVESTALPTAVLRRHMESEESVKHAAIEVLTKLGYELDPEWGVGNLLSHAKSKMGAKVFSTFVHSILGEFKRAEYVMASETPSVSHWGVGATKYMHFTSPIRRYADLIVHRILGDSGPLESAESIAQQIKRCNRNAKAAQEAESWNKLFYFTTFVRAFGYAGYPIDAVVKELIFPDDTRGVKASVQLHLPLIGEVRSQSLDSIGLEMIERTDNGMTARLKREDSESFILSPLQLLRMRAYTKRDTSSKFHLRMDSSPIQPPSAPRN